MSALNVSKTFDLAAYVFKLDFEALLTSWLEKQVDSISLSEALKRVATYSLSHMYLGFCFYNIWGM